MATEGLGERAEHPEYDNVNFAAVAYRLVRTPGAPSYFDRLYKISTDPFSHDTSRYDARKLQRVISLAAEQPHDRVLDVGCGTGVITQALASLSRSVVGIDFSREALRLAALRNANNAAITFLQLDIAAAAVSGMFDLIVCSEVLYYLKGDQLAAAVRNLRGACVEQGTVLAVLPARHERRVRAELSGSFALRYRQHVRDWRRPYTLTLWSPIESADAATRYGTTSAPARGSRPVTL